jgi:hypothetical protein
MKHLFFGTLIVWMAFLAAPLMADDAAAAKLAASLNKIAAKSATADGGTVWVKGEARLSGSLTVPAGVTLDLTADKARLVLGNGAKLTVDGTVIARGHGEQGKGGVEGSIRLDAGKTLINGSGIISLKSKRQILNIWSKCNFTLDGVTLVGIADNDSSLVEVSNGGKFTMKSGKITGNRAVSSEEICRGGGVSVYRGTFTLEGGEISGNSIAGSTFGGGGGVFVHKGTFTMKGGKISGNSADGNTNGDGGGVFVEHGSVFTLENGEISGNNAACKGGWASAGGVLVYDDSVFTMSGGLISGNTVVSGKDARGGGVKVKEAVFTMKGGTIAGNTTIAADTSFGGGGGVCVEESTFTLQGGTIYGNDAAAKAGGTANETKNSKGVPVSGGAALSVVWDGTTKWGTGGTYTKGGKAQTGGSDIVSISGSPKQGGTDDTLVAIPKGKK